MSFAVNLYRFSKKANSTARPSTPNQTYNCLIKEPCSVITPVIGLNMGLTTSPSSYNYAYISEFDRYYFIRDWTFENATWYATLEIDVLASWKITIGKSENYVLRSSQDFNLEVRDGTYPAISETETRQIELTSPWVTDDVANGMFIVGVVGTSTTYYLFTPYNFNMFLNWLFSDLYVDQIVGSTWNDIFPQAKAQTNPMQYITSVLWIPFTTVTSEPVTTVKVGWADVPVAGCWKINGAGITGGIRSFIVPDHPQISRGEYLNNFPYTRYSLFFPPWGKIDLDPDLMASALTLEAIWDMDYRTGQGTLRISVRTDATNYILMSWTHSQIGVNYQISQVVNQGFGLGNALGHFSRGATSAISGNVAGVITNGISLVQDTVMNSIPSATTLGSNGGLNALLGKPTLQMEYKILVDEDLEHRGRPLCEHRVINTLSGFIMVADGDIKLPATKQEIESVKSYMEGGFFYE